jgi:hypothetical protein
VEGEALMHEFTSTGHWYFESRKLDIYYVAEDSLPDGLWTPQQLMGTEVLVDGQQMKVATVESHPVMRSPEHPYKLKFGIAVSRAAMTCCTCNGQGGFASSFGADPCTDCLGQGELPA